MDVLPQPVVDPLALQLILAKLLYHLAEVVGAAITFVINKEK
jgi:hypothetical protein